MPAFRNAKASKVATVVKIFFHWLIATCDAPPLVVNDASCLLSTLSSCCRGSVRRVVWSPSPRLCGCKDISSVVDMCNIRLVKVSRGDVQQDTTEASPTLPCRRSPGAWTVRLGSQNGMTCAVATDLWRHTLLRLLISNSSRYSYTCSYRERPAMHILWAQWLKLATLFRTMLTVEAVSYKV